jgi:hypothetical protein
MSLSSQTAAVQSGDDHPNHMSGQLLAKRTIKILLGTLYGTVSVEFYFLKCPHFTDRLKSKYVILKIIHRFVEYLFLLF